MKFGKSNGTSNQNNGNPGLGFSLFGNNKSYFEDENSMMKSCNMC